MTTTTAEPTVTMTQLEKRCCLYNQACADLENMIAEVEADLQAVKRKHLAALKQQAGHVAVREATLRADLEAAPGLFIKPRTAVFHGIKIGFTTGKGRVEFDNAEAVVRLVDKHLPGLADILVRTTREPDKEQLKHLSAADLAKVGARYVTQDNIPLLKRVAGDVEQLVDKLITKMVEAMAEPTA